MSDQEDCPRIESLSALIDDELETGGRAALQAHVAGCAICSPVLAGTGFGIGYAGSNLAIRNQPSLSHSTGWRSVWRPRL